MKPIPIYPASRLKDLPPIEWLVEGLLPAGGMCMLYGPPGVGKSFVALDMCLAIAAGQSWLGTRAVLGGACLYLPLEAVAGLGQRLLAWEAYHQLETPEELYYAIDYTTLQAPEPIRDLLGGISATLEGDLRLVVVDTLSRGMVGAEENSARDANLAMSNLDRLRRDTGCAVLLLHHTAKYTDVERGSTAIRAACDTVLLLKSDGEGLVLSTEKQREAEPTGPIRLYMQPSDRSVVITPTPPSSAQRELTPDLQLALSMLRDLSIGGEPVSLGTWQEAAEERNITRAVFRKRVNLLLEKGYVEKTGTGARAQYVPVAPGDVESDNTRRRRVSDGAENSPPPLRLLGAGEGTSPEDD